MILSSIMELNTQSAVLILLVVCRLAMSSVSDHEVYDDTRCGKGTFIKSDSGRGPQCAPCPDGMYMDEDNHDYHFCKWCTNYSAEPNVEATLQCTAERNTAIDKCKDGFYIDHRPDEYGCNPCPPCAKVRQDQQECCRTTERTTTPRLNPTTTPTPGPVSTKTKHATDRATQSEYVTRQQSEPSASYDSQLPFAQFVLICCACVFLVIVTVFLIPHLDALRKNRRPFTVCDIIRSLYRKKSKYNTNTDIPTSC